MSGVTFITGYIEVSVKKRLPKRKGNYITKIGDGCDFCWQDTLFENGKWTDTGTDKVFVWLEKIKIATTNKSKYK